MFAVPRPPSADPTPLRRPPVGRAGRAGRVPLTALQSLVQPPLRFLASPWPWRSLAYLLSGALLGVIPLYVLMVAFTYGVVPATVLAVLTVVCSALPLARFERLRARLVDHEPLPAPREGSGPGLRARLRARLGAQSTWRELGYTLIALPALWWLDLGVIFFAGGLPGMLMSAPFQPGTFPPFGVFLALCGVALLPAGVYPVTAWAGVRALLVRAILAPRDAELTEVVRSRARLVDAFEVERRRIERDLHDGAQQRLVALTLKLGMARLDLEPGSPADRSVAEAHEEAMRALAELRELIQGVHPRVLTDLGLPAAVLDVAGRSPVPVDVDVVLPRRPPPAAEITAYFVVCEALANVARHSGASRCAVRGRLVHETLLLEIHDNGEGGAAPAAGTGLAGLADRIAVVDGTMSLSSPAGGPTLLRVEIPCARPPETSRTFP
ncbi:sensor domain-containing protein [Streptosporangium sp. NPDC051022]|uniref:sensor histidine kinase n=1 Tax=Streptosporangium sp. NPDC051022 TaxID=3155752 RepID=UPI0034484B99